MGKIIDISNRYDDFCIICLKELKGEKRRGRIPTNRKENEYIIIASCNECYHKIIKRHMNDLSFWTSLYEDRGIFEDLPPIKEI